MNPYATSHSEPEEIIQAEIVLEQPARRQESAIEIVVWIAVIAVIASLYAAHWFWMGIRSFSESYFGSM